VVAFADLGGLGPKQGAPVVYDWVMPSLMPQVLPWLAILVLLMLKPNRCASAWWVLVPLGCVAGVAGVPQSWLELLPSAQFEIFLEWIGALGFGLAAMWLLSSYLAWRHRLLTFLGMLVAQMGFSLLAFAIRQGWEETGPETAQIGIALAVSVLVISVAVSLAGLVCRGRYGWLRLTLWVMAALVVVWVLVIGPFFIIAVVSSGDNVPMVALFGIVGVAAGITFGVLLPFLVLSFANGFYRERLKGLLHLGGAASPPMIAPPMPALATASGCQGTVLQGEGLRGVH
jgi:hypothetical protein